MKTFLIALFSSLLFGCGSKPDSLTKDQKSFDRLSTKIDALAWKACNHKDLKFCFELNIDLQFLDRVEKQTVSDQDFKFEIKDLNKQILASGSARSTNFGKLVLKAQILIPQDKRFSKLPLRLHIQSETYGELDFDFIIDLLDSSDQSKSFQKSNDDLFIAFEKKDLNDFEIELAEQKILDVTSISKHEEKVSFFVRARLIDEETRLGIPWSKLKIKVTDLLSNQAYTEEKTTGSEGDFDFQFSLTRFRFSHESQKKIRVDIFFESDVFDNQFTQYWIIDLEPDSNIFLHSRMSESEIMQNDFWRDRNRRYAAQTPPQIFLNKIAVVEIPLKEAWKVSKKIQLIRYEKLMFDFNLSLERAGFRGPRSRSLSSQRVSVKLGLTETEIENFLPTTWTEIQDFEVRSEQNDDYSLSYLKESFLGPTIKPSHPWFLMETSLLDFPLIAPSYHIIRWPNLYFKNLPQTRLALPTPSKRKPVVSNFPVFEMSWESSSPPHQEKLWVWLEDGQANDFELSAKESLELLEWMKNQALNAGRPVQTKKPWYALRSFKVVDLIDQSLLLKEELGQEQKQLQFSIGVSGHPCISFACDDQIMSVCSQKTFELESNLSFFVENLSENLAHRMLKPDEFSNETQYPWMIDGFLFFELHSGLKFR